MSTLEGAALDQAAVQGTAIKPSDVTDVVVIQDGEHGGDASLGWWGPVEHEGLSMVQRILLTTDGTVTRTLEACAGEPMELVKLSQSSMPAASAGRDLGVAEDDEVLFRRILMRGARSGRHLLYAESLIAPSRLHPRLRHGLHHSDAPIGRLLWEHRVETVRELVRWGLEPAGGCAAYFDVDPDHTLVSRTYRVVSQRQPIMLITEKLPADSFPD